MSGFPVVTICGSMRFRAEMDQAAQRLSRKGFIVLMPFVTFTPDEQLSDPDKAMLDEMHRAKIDLSQSIHVVNPGGYIGESTRGEIAYAVATGKGVSSVEPLDVKATADAPPGLLHYSANGTGGVCGIEAWTTTDEEFHVAFDPADAGINCPPCRTYLAGLRVGTVDGDE